MDVAYFQLISINISNNEVQIPVGGWFLYYKSWHELIWQHYHNVSLTHEDRKGLSLRIQFERAT